MPYETNQGPSFSHHVDQFRPEYPGDTKPDMNVECGLPKNKATARVQPSCSQYTQSETGFMEHAKSRFIDNEGKLTDAGKILKQCILQQSCTLARVFDCGEVFTK